MNKEFPCKNWSMRYIISPPKYITNNGCQTLNCPKLVVTKFEDGSKFTSCGNLQTINIDYSDLLKIVINKRKMEEK